MFRIQLKVNVKVNFFLKIRTPSKALFIRRPNTYDKRF